MRPRRTGERHGRLGPRGQTVYCLRRIRGSRRAALTLDLRAQRPYVGDQGADGVATAVRFARQLRGPSLGPVDLEESHGQAPAEREQGSAIHRPTRRR
ncbi:MULTISPECIES: hypothetical protein [unclassified Streptomyces]|uniref:hypothetical protein n=1 Tax=Streptomyces sp. NPDC055082 TaxID=3365718 RepID=UPI0037CD8BC5